MELITTQQTVGTQTPETNRQEAVSSTEAGHTTWQTNNKNKTEENDSLLHYLNRREWQSSTLFKRFKR